MGAWVQRPRGFWGVGGSDALLDLTLDRTSDLCVPFISALPSVSLQNLLDAPANGTGPSEVSDGLGGGV